MPTLEIFSDDRLEDATDKFIYVLKRLGFKALDISQEDYPHLKYEISPMENSQDQPDPTAPHNQGWHTPPALPEQYLALADYPARIENANLNLDQCWQDFYVAQKAEDDRHLELLSVTAQGSNAEMRKNWRAEQVGDDIPYLETKRDRIHAKTMVNESEFCRDRLRMEFSVARLHFAAQYGIREI